MKPVIILGAPLLAFCVGIPIAVSSLPRAKPIQSANHQKPVAREVGEVERLYGFPVFRTHASYFAPADLEELIQRSELIAIGKTPKNVTEGKAVIPRADDGTIYGVYTEVPFKIAKTFKGDKKLKEITLAQAAAVIPAENEQPAYIQIVGEYTPIEPNTRYLMFLKKPTPETDNPNLYVPIGVIYGQHNLVSDEEEKKFPDRTFKEIRKLVRERFKE
jgi:hypothetical protein